MKGWAEAIVNANNVEIEQGEAEDEDLEEEEEIRCLDVNLEEVRGIFSVMQGEKRRGEHRGEVDYGRIHAV